MQTKTQLTIWISYAGRIWPWKFLIFYALLEIELDQSFREQIILTCIIKQRTRCHLIFNDIIPWGNNWTNPWDFTSQYKETHLGQSQSPFFLSISSKLALLGPSALHWRHCWFLEKLTKPHLQQNQRAKVSRPGEITYREWVTIIIWQHKQRTWKMGKYLAAGIPNKQKEFNFPYLSSILNSNFPLYDTRLCPIQREK